MGHSCFWLLGELAGQGDFPDGWGAEAGELLVRPLRSCEAQDVKATHEILGLIIQIVRISWDMMR